MTAPDLDDPIRNEWIAAAASRDVAANAMLGVVVCGERIALTRAIDGELRAFADQCPHRGAQLTLGSFDGDRLACPYHGWQFDRGGDCVHQPAHPTLTPPPHCGLRSYRAVERYGLIWVCLGASPSAMVDYPAFDRRPDRNSVFGPKTLASSAPRIIENFLDMAHFPFVHNDYLGQTPHNEVRNYTVRSTADEVEATDCWFWQPRPGPHATEGGDVAYRYHLNTPYTASLDKLPAEVDGGEAGAFSLLIVASPVEETRCRVWMVQSAYGDDTPLETFDAFQEIIFAQDIPVVESQLPKLLPLDLHAERHQAADRLALAYRAWLKARGVRYGTC
jgi:phenylpropionate dioxygenase-like ring-hydroxylating dioxygenase large terminal subunit